MNVKVYLHCFEYGRKHAGELEALCEKVYYYPRKTGLFSGLSALPYTVKSRQSEELEKNLLTNNYPILFEVLHTCYLLNDVRFKNRIRFYRHSNIEHDYYKHLAISEHNFFKRFYLKLEARKLERFEPIINEANYILAVNKEDADYFEKRYKTPKTIYLPSFHANNEIDIKQGKGNYILYHGNLSVSENYEAALWLINHVFKAITYPVIIAGLNPPEFLKEAIAACKNIQLIENPGDEQMKGLISDAHIHCLYTEQATGLKLKLLNVLFSGRFVICNSKMIKGTSLRCTDISGSYSFNLTEEALQLIADVMQKDFSEKELNARKTELEAYSNQVNIEKLISLI